MDISNNKTQLKVIIYYSYIYKIGGIESWLFYMSQNLCHFYDITLLFDNGNIKQLKRINKYIKVEKREIKKQYDCDVVLYASHLNRYPENVIAKKAISVVHSDYKYYKNLLDQYIIGEHADQMVCVSERAAQSLKDICGKDSVVIPNILGEKIKEHRVLHLVSFTRLTREKGYNRMCKLVKLLKENNIKFDWKIFSDIDNITELEKIKCPEVIFMNPTLDTIDYITDADYLVQLSDTEAFCYSVHEALQYGTAVIVTDIEVFKDIVVNGYNGYKLKLDMSNVNGTMINNIVNNIPKDFEYDDKHEELVSKWFDVIGDPVKSDKNNMSEDCIKLVVLEDFHDLVKDTDHKAGDIIIVDNLRAYELTSVNNKMRKRICKTI